MAGGADRAQEAELTNALSDHDLERVVDDERGDEDDDERKGQQDVVEDRDDLVEALGVLLLKDFGGDDLHPRTDGSLDIGLHRRNVGTSLDDHVDLVVAVLLAEEALRLLELERSHGLAEARVFVGRTEAENADQLEAFLLLRTVDRIRLADTQTIVARRGHVGGKRAGGRGLLAFDDEELQRREAEADRRWPLGANRLALAVDDDDVVERDHARNRAGHTIHAGDNSVDRLRNGRAVELLADLQRRTHGEFGTGRDVLGQAVEAGAKRIGQHEHADDHRHADHHRNGGEREPDLLIEQVLDREAEHRSVAQALHHVEHAVRRRLAQLVDDLAVDEEDDPVGVRRSDGIVGDHHDGLTELVDCAAHERQNLVAGRGVEVAGGFVGEDDFRPRRQGPAHGDTLLLATRELVGTMGGAVGQPDRFDHLIDPTLIGGLAGEVHRQRDVLDRRQGRDEVEGLENEAHIVASQQRQILLRKGRQRRLTDEDLTIGQVVEPRHAVHEGRLARARRAHDRGELTSVEGHVDPVEGADFGVAGSVDLGGADSARGKGGGRGVGHLRTPWGMHSRYGQR